MIVEPCLIPVGLSLTGSDNRTGKQSGPYVSPSDNILSPASAKLNAFKEKRFNRWESLSNFYSDNIADSWSRTVKPRTLFGKPSSTSPLTHPDVDDSKDSKS